ncbi:MAG: hypothetical protein K1X28_05405 [Parachlamydiales bacterium]|nr:hypothetical protein [Parachlamydiales bacterium]
MATIHRSSDIKMAYAHENCSNCNRPFGPKNLGQHFFCLNDEEMKIQIEWAHSKWNKKKKVHLKPAPPIPRASMGPLKITIEPDFVDKPIETFPLKEEEESWFCTIL